MCMCIVTNFKDPEQERMETDALYHHEKLFQEIRRKLQFHTSSKIKELNGPFNELLSGFCA